MMSRLCVEELDLDMRSWNCLKKAGIHYVDTLVLNTPAQLREIRNFGRKSLWQVERKLAERGLKLAGPGDAITIDGHGPTDRIAFLPVEERQTREEIRGIGLQMLELVKALVHSPAVYTDRTYLSDAKQLFDEISTLCDQGRDRLRWLL